MADDTPVIELSDVTVRFGGETVYRDMSFSVRQGEFLCILGPSGCGKSTSLRLIGDLLDVQDGTVRVEGMPPRQAWHKLAYVFQSPRLAPWRDALQNVTLGMELRDVAGGKRERQAIAEMYLTLVGLGGDMHKYPGMLSGGERQRVAIARALAVDPDIILMDEPFSALDLNTRRRLRSELVSIWQETGKTIVFVTHDIDEALTLADRILLLSGKPTKVLEVMDLDEERPRALDTAASLKARREKLVALFEELERGADDEQRAKETAS